MKLFYGSLTTSPDDHSRYGVPIKLDGVGRNQMTYPK
jgi:hypothetical protein